MVNIIMKKIDISIIIPVYNVEVYLKECLNSVINQNFQNYEIICVDDASTDNSVKILFEYIEKQDNIKVIRHSENKGLSAARNTGLAYAAGKYIWFIDSDDLILPDSLMELYTIAEKAQTDIVFFNLVRMYKDTDCRKMCVRNDMQISLGKVCQGKKFFSQAVSNHTYISSVCLQFIKTNFLKQNNIGFYNDILHEDELFSFLSTMSAQRVLYVDKKYYIYRQREGSIMSGKNYMRAESLFVIMVQILTYWKSHNLNDEENKAIGVYFQSLYDAFLDYSCFGDKTTELSVGGYIEKLLYKMLQKKVQSKYLTLDETQIVQIRQFEKVIVFGSGKAAIDIIRILEKQNIKIDTIAVSHLEGNPEKLCGIQVQVLDGLAYDTNETVVIVGVSEKYQLEILEKLYALGYRKIIVPKNIVKAGAYDK